MYKLFLFSALSLIWLNAEAQYAPAAALEGSTAIHADSSIIDSWATECNVTRSWVNISDPNFQYNESNFASYGSDTDATEKADNQTVSLGDGGSAIVSFSKAISNENGFDFAVFENSFSPNFLELAFVEVSSDGERFVRFPSVSLTQTETQIGGFDNISDATKIHNLAGKYKAFYGTPFDLDDLKDSTAIDLKNITHIKIIDVIGSINDEYASFDSKGNKINEPFPTPYHTCGFDLDAVAVLKQVKLSVEKQNSFHFQVYPNPFADFIKLRLPFNGQVEISILNMQGKLVFTKKVITSEEFIKLNFLEKGIYFLKIKTTNFSEIKKIIKQ